MQRRGTAHVCDNRCITTDSISACGLAAMDIASVAWLGGHYIVA